MLTKKCCWGLLIWSAGSLFSWSVSPPVQTINSQSTGAFYKLRADAQESDLPVQIRAAIRVMDENGVETYSEKADDLFVFPKQVILKAGTEQMVRVQWKGKKPPSSELAYRIIVEQIPVPLPTSPDENLDLMQVSIQMGTRYVCSLYVEPQKPHSKLQLNHFAFDGESRELEFELENKGNIHKLVDMDELGLFVRDAENREFPIPTEIFEKMNLKSINILAGHKRKMKIPLEEALSGQIVSMELKKK